MLLLVIFTWAPGTALPCGSVTRPESVPLAACAHAIPVAKAAVAAVIIHVLRMRPS